MKTGRDFFQVMADVLRTPFVSSSPSTPTHNALLIHGARSFVGDGGRISELEINTRSEEKREKDRRDQLSLLAILVTSFRKSFSGAWKRDRFGFSGSSGKLGSGVMEIGWPTDAQHVIHVTFDRFDGFLGLPVEFELEVPRRAPSASATVFGVSTDSMQLSYDHRGIVIPTILLLMQRRLYFQGGLKAEGIFRITAGNSHEEFVRGQLNRGIVPEGIDVHCLAGLIKAWFRELPIGVLDHLSPDQVMQCVSEDDCDRLVRLLPPTESALLDWAINLMADVVQEESSNKMNARNIAMVFAPNMTKMADPRTALMYVVQVMNFLKTLIEKTLRQRRESIVESVSVIIKKPPGDDNGNQSSSRLHQDDDAESNPTPVLHSSPSPCVDTGSSSPVGDEDDISYTTESSYASVFCEPPAETGKASCRKILDNDGERRIQLMCGSFDHSERVCDNNSGIGSLNLCYYSSV